MKPDAIRDKFGDDFIADERTFTMGIDQRFTTHLAERFRDLRVLETCTGGGFSTMALARTAKSVVTVEVDPAIQRQAMANVRKALLADRVKFIPGSIMDEGLLAELPEVDGAFLDPDWAVTGPDHVFRFLNSNTLPPADVLLEKICSLTENIALVLPPLIDVRKLDGLLEHERESLYLGDSHELYCLYFGKLMRASGESEFRTP